MEIVGAFTSHFTTLTYEVGVGKWGDLYTRLPGELCGWVRAQEGSPNHHEALMACLIEIEKRKERGKWM